MISTDAPQQVPQGFDFALTKGMLSKVPCGETFLLGIIRACDAVEPSDYASVITEYLSTVLGEKKGRHTD